MTQEITKPVWDPIAHLNGCHTREIMILRDAAYKYGHGAVHLLDYDPYHTITIDQIRQVLATREHIPNKVEAKIIRREKARAKQHR